MTTQDNDTRDDDKAIGSLLTAAGKRRAPPVDTSAEIEAAVHSAWRAAVAARKGRRGVVRFAVAATVALAAGVLAWQFPRGPAPAVAPAATVAKLSGEAWVTSGDAAQWTALGAGDSLAAHSRVRTGAGARLALNIGGLSLRADQATRFALASDTLIALEMGGLYLDSGDSVGAAGTLTIDTPLGAARHVGTQYEVRLAPASLTLRVREGFVELSRDGEATVSEAGEQIVRLSDGREERDVIAPDAETWLWAETMAPAFDIEDRSLSEFLDWVSRETGRPLKYADETARRQARQLVLRGSVSGLPPRQALAAVMATTGLTATEQDGTLVVSTQR